MDIAAVDGQRERTMEGARAGGYRPNDAEAFSGLERDVALVFLGNETTDEALRQWDEQTIGTADVRRPRVVRELEASVDREVFVVDPRRQREREQDARIDEQRRVRAAVGDRLERRRAIEVPPMVVSA